MEINPSHFWMLDEAGRDEIFRRWGDNEGALHFFLWMLWDDGYFGHVDLPLSDVRFEVEHTETRVAEGFTDEWVGDPLLLRDGPTRPPTRDRFVWHQELFDMMSQS